MVIVVISKACDYDTTGGHDGADCDGQEDPKSTLPSSLNLTMQLEYNHWTTAL